LSSTYLDLPLLVVCRQRRYCDEFCDGVFS
jgi:hypothetical protein